MTSGTKGRDEATSIDRLPQLSDDHVWMLRHESPEPGEGQGAAQVEDVDGGQVVPLTSEGQYGVGTRVDPATDTPSEVHAEE
ncbi:MAG: hypothetical protein ACPHWZ_12855, partial [Longimicrobiales bacterium]